MIKNIFLFFLFLSITSYGQVKLEGIVKDSLKAPLESASLVAIDQKTNNLESYVLTDINGKYKLNLKNNSNYKIQVTIALVLNELSYMLFSFTFCRNRIKLSNSLDLR